MAKDILCNDFKQMAQGQMLSDKNPRRTDLIEQIVVKIILDKVPAEQMLFSQTSQSHSDR
jgi:hypothetical protein